MKTAERTQTGFSLLEVLIAIAILAGVAMVLGPAISAAARASSRIHQGAAIEEDLRTARQFFNDIIQQEIILDGKSTGTVLTGEASSLTLTTLDPGNMSPVNVKLTLTNDAPGALVAKFTTAGNDEAQNYTLLSNVIGARFEFLENAQWREAWHDATPPALIRLTGMVALGKENRAFVFEAAPRGAAPLHCQFDPVSRRCR